MVLLLEALARCIKQQDKDFGDVTASSLRRIICNEDYEGADRYKLRLSGDDQSAFIDLMTENDSGNDNQSKINENFDFFFKKIKNLTSKQAKWFFQGLIGLQVVSILLKPNDDEPQHVFESMNSKGKPLSASDLVRNYILMKLRHEKQEELHRTYWRRIEKNLRFKEEDLLEPFIRDYLLYKKGESVGRETQRIYREFQVCFQNSKRTETEFLGDMLTHSTSYASFIFPGKTDDAKLSRTLEDWRGFAKEPSTPLMLALYACLRDECFDVDELGQIIHLIENYSFRRWACNLPPNARNAVFMDLIKKVNGRAEFKNGYFASLTKYFRAQDNRKRFPGDEEFIHGLLGIDIYVRGGYCRYVLSKLENYGQKERIDLDNLTIEHIMPQHLTLDWQEKLGKDYEAVHSRFLHKLGNLTLTGYDPQLSNKPFLEKRDYKGGYKDSPLRLNDYVGKQEKWTQEEIEARGKILAEQAVRVWAYPDDE